MSELRKNVRWFADIADYRAERIATKYVEVNVTT